MRVIFESPPIPMTLIEPRSSESYKGFGFLRVWAYDPGEQPPLRPGTDKPIARTRPISELRAEAGVGKPIVATPVGQFVNFLKPTVIPESAIAQLPDTATLEWRWRFVPGEVWRGSL
jgi:hypothetical protein